MNSPPHNTSPQEVSAQQTQAYDENTVRLSTVASPSDEELLAGVTGYGKIQPIARGSSALVYKAVQTTLKREVAIKLLFIDEQLTTAENVAFELDTLVRLSQHPHIVTVIDTGVTDHEQPFIVMEYCGGGSYEQILKKSGPLSVESVLEVGIKIGDALAAAHEVGVVHRDVKPPNLLRTRYGPALSDFGVAYLDDQELDESFRKITPHHASPEALLQQPQTHKSDIYSLGSTLWNLLAGTPPFDDPGSNPEEFRQRVLTQPVPRVPRSDVPDWLHNALTTAMAKRPAHRHASADDFVELLRTYSNAGSGSAPTVTSGSPAITSAQPYSGTPYSGAPYSGPPSLSTPANVAPTSAQPTEIVYPTPATAPPTAPPPISPYADVSWSGHSHPELEDTGEDNEEEEDDDDSPQPKRGGVRRALLIAGFAGSLLGIITAVTMFLTGGGDPSSDNNNRTEPTRNAEIVSEAKPANVTLNDRGDNVLISWSDTSEGETPFVIYSAFSGGASQLHTSVDAGETSVTLHGLRSDGDYCFTVAALVTDRFGNTNQAPAPSTCTTRS